MREIHIGKSDAGQRLNKFLGRYLDDAPQSFLYKMMRKKNIKYNNAKCSGNELLLEGDVISVYMTDETIAKFRKDGRVFDADSLTAEKAGEAARDAKITDTSLDILYEDSDVLIVNKPTNLLSQKARSEDVSLNEMIVAHYQNLNGNTLFVPSVCNRLDRNTSGVVLAGMSLTGSQCLSKMLKERTIDKYYLTVVSGRIEGAQKVRGYLSKESSHNQVTVYPADAEDIPANASYIETAYEPLACGTYSDMEFTLLRVKLITGKTHQIRAHLKAQGHPIIGDGKYGDKQVNDRVRRELQHRYQLLHAYCVTFPSDVLRLSDSLVGRRITAPLPKHFLDILHRIFGIDEIDKVL